MTTTTDAETGAGTDASAVAVDLEGGDPDYERLVRYLLTRYGDELRWIASFDADRCRYDVEYVRDDLRTELTSYQFDVVVHRSIALFNRPYVEEVYTRLGDARSLVLQHDRATAVHIYLSETDGLIVKIRAGTEIGVPGFIHDCLAALYGADEPARTGDPGHGPRPTVATAPRAARSTEDPSAV